ncbi:MAG: aspartate/tyrosine/aromatic aminotransferase [Phycisphaerae bacterium]|nr:aspartate/tyrosine/aromatic aminotransferase [Phycisphaerae bacterium]
MFEKLEMAPPDPILGLTEAFNKDPNPDKINLGVGVYQDATGKTPVFSAVARAEKVMADKGESKKYLPITGHPGYNAAVAEMVFGAGSEILRAKRVAVCQSLGGTGGLRIGADFAKKVAPDAKVWVSDPTWTNHLGIFGAAGFEIGAYPYYDPKTKAVDFEKMIEALKAIPRGHIVLLHACCHNPSGADPTPQQWKTIAKVTAERGLLPFLDFAYQGFGDGLEKDAVGVRAMAETGQEMLIVASFSKNFGLYNERVGALLVVCKSAADAEKAISHVKIVVRQNWSNPPSHGASIVAAILSDAGLRAEWEQELKATCGRIHEMRRLFVETLKSKGVQRDFSFIIDQKGMFSFSGLSKEQVQTLRDKYAIYIVGSGRINVAGITPGNVDRLCDAVADVLK